MELPAGLTSRPLTLSDAAAVTAAMAAQEIVDVGEVMIEEADIVGDWQRPSFDVSTATIGVFDGDDLVAYAEFSGADRGDAAVHPEYRGRGIGTALARWMQLAARGQGATVASMPVPIGSAGEQLLRQLGYRERWHSWIFRLPPGRDIVPQPLPTGYTVREADPTQYRDVWAVVDSAFLEWSDREPEAFADFSAKVFQRPTFASWNARVAVDADGSVVGAAHIAADGTSAHVYRLAVVPAHRHRGLARALLVDSFAAGRTHGATVFDLVTDSRTGARTLYEKVGMEVANEWVTYAMDV